MPDWPTLCVSDKAPDITASFSALEAAITYAIVTTIGPTCQPPVNSAFKATIAATITTANITAVDAALSAAEPITDDPTHPRTRLLSNEAAISFPNFATDATTRSQTFWSTIPTAFSPTNQPA